MRSDQSGQFGLGLDIFQGGLVFGVVVIFLEHLLHEIFLVLFVFSCEFEEVFVKLFSFLNQGFDYLSQSCSTIRVVSRADCQILNNINGTFMMSIQAFSNS